MPSYPAKKCANKIKLSPPPWSRALVNQWIFVHLSIFSHCNNIFIFVSYSGFISPPSLVWSDVLIKFRFLVEEFKSFCKPTFLQSWQIPPSKFYCSPTWKVKSYFCCQVIHSKVFAEKEKETHNKIFNSVQSKRIFSPFMHNNAKTSSPSIFQVRVSVAAFLFIFYLT